MENTYSDIDLYMRNRDMDIESDLDDSISKEEEFKINDKFKNVYY